MVEAPRRFLYRGMMSTTATRPTPETPDPAAANALSAAGAVPDPLPIPAASDEGTLLNRRDAHLVITAGVGWGGLIVQAWRDLAETWSLRRLIWTLAFLDIKLRYRGSLLGPFWLTLSTAVMIAALGFVYSHLFKTDLHTYLPFLSLSLVLWNNFITSTVTDACVSYTSVNTTIHAMRMPLSMHAARSVVRNVMVLAHSIIVIVVVFALEDTWPGHIALLSIPAFLLWLVDGMAVSVLLGGFCARFRDVPPIVASIMQIAFFVSPIIWSPQILKDRGIGVILLNWNPFYSLLEIVRAPLLNQIPSMATWDSALGYSAGLIAISALFFIRSRGRIAFWV
ncbi:ABC transporter permease [Acidiphilium acidophilum]|uniref:ABC transporter permease n=1 Tax=Acidiphilium acidophilum TaxID=76588 RepID=UPI002E8E69E1|nr:ABC transporter permease [Acidiphilium acidophilum]